MVALFFVPPLCHAGAPQRLRVMPPTIGRSYWAHAVSRQDWDEKAVNAEVGYWELFTDLLMVAAASAVAEVLLEDMSWHGFLEFALLYTILVHGWWLYSHHYTTRFVESSLAHHVVLCVFLWGLATSIANASLETAAEFSMGAIVQRMACVVMMVPIGIQMPRARAFVTAVVGWTLLIVVVLLGVVLEWYSPMTGWLLASILHHLSEVVMIYALPGRALLPVNIEHTTDRLGVLVLIMLGETVISATLTYRSYVVEDEAMEEGSSYSMLLFSAFALIFVFSLLYFGVQPPEHFNALRRSREFGTLAVNTVKLLGLLLLTVGVCVRLLVQETVEGKDESEARRLLGYAVGSSMLLLLGLRVCHYGGRIPRADDPPRVWWLSQIWWAIFAIVSASPLVLAATLDLSAVATIATYAGIVSAMCVVETWFIQELQDYLPNEDDETQHMLDRSKDYGSTH